MVVCYHFQRGNCRFGASCKFEHSDFNYDSYYHTNDSSRYAGDQYHFVKPLAATPQPVKNDADQIFDMVAGDTMVAVHGRQWPFSSYGPVKGYQNIAGLEDISPEELRYLMYSAKETGKVEECKRHWNELLQIENMKRTLLTTRSAEADAAIHSIYRSEDQQPGNPIRTGTFQPSSPVQSRNAAESHSASIFGGSSYAAPFPTTTNNANVFGGSTSPPFGPTHSTNVFGGGTSAGVFGANASGFEGSCTPTQPASSVFGSAPSGLFSAAAAAVSQQSGGFFGSAVAQPVPGISTATPGGFFGVSPAQPPSGLFANAAANSGFAPPPTTGSSSIFGGSWAAPPATFGPTSPTPAPTQTFQSFPSNNDAFNKSNVSSGLFVQANDVNSSVYTPLSDLDDEEKAAFQAKTFTSGKIPIRPPPRELCF